MPDLASLTLVQNRYRTAVRHGTYWYVRASIGRHDGVQVGRVWTHAAQDSVGRSAIGRIGARSMICTTGVANSYGGGCRTSAATRCNGATRGCGSTRTSDATGASGSRATTGRCAAADRRATAHAGNCWKHCLYGRRRWEIEGRINANLRTGRIAGTRARRSRGAESRNVTTGRDAAPMRARDVLPASGDLIIFALPIGPGRASRHHHRSAVTVRANGQTAC
jgi:hypothetical protein